MFTECILNKGVVLKKVILICGSCGRQTESGNSSKDLQKRIQTVIKGQRDNVLVLLSSCLDVCPEKGTTLGYSTANGISIEVVADDFNEELILEKI